MMKWKQSGWYVPVPLRLALLPPIDAMLSKLPNTFVVRLHLVRFASHLCISFLGTGCPSKRLG